MKKILPIFLLSILFLAAGCNSKQQADSSQSHKNNQNQATTTSSTDTQDPQKEYEESREQFVLNAISDIQKSNSNLSQILLKQYSGLPKLKEDTSSIQSYVKFYDSLSGNNVLYTLTTYSKLPNDVNDFSGELGTKNTVFYLCSNISKTCRQSDIIERAFKAGQPGYIIGFGYCTLGWDDVNQRIYSYLCGEGGDSSKFGEFEYGTGKSYVIGKQGSLYYLAINKQLTRFAMQKTSADYKPIAIEIYITSDPTKSHKTIDITKLPNTDSSQGGLVDFKWDDNNDALAYFNYQKKNFMLNSDTGEITAR